LYFRYRPTRVPLAVDPALITHRAFGVSKFQLSPELMEAFQTTRTDARGELPQPGPSTPSVRPRLAAIRPRANGIRALRARVGPGKELGCCRSRRAAI
jgi:hypothetical protein